MYLGLHLGDSVAASHSLARSDARKKGATMRVPTTGHESDANLIRERDYIAKLYQAKVLRDFLIFGDARKKDVEASLPKLGAVNAYKYDARKGRTPSPEEWDQ